MPNGRVESVEVVGKDEFHALVIYLVQRAGIKACRKGKRCAKHYQQCGYYKRFFHNYPFLRPIRTPYFFTLLYHKAERERRGKIKFRLKRAASWNKKSPLGNRAGDDGVFYFSKTFFCALPAAGQSGYLPVKQPLQNLTLALGTISSSVFTSRKPSESASIFFKSSSSVYLQQAS